MTRSARREHRHAAFAVLEAVAENPALHDDFVLKGGLALHYGYGSPRWSSDLDFTAVKPFQPQITPKKNLLLAAFCDRLDDGLRQTAPRHGFVEMGVMRRTFSREIPAVMARIGYTRERERRLPAGRVLEMQVTLSEIVCETARATVEGIPVHLASLEDVLAEKLKSLLQQVPRDKSRPSDVYDLWYFAGQPRCPVDLEKVARFLQIKSVRWEAITPITQARFSDSGVRAHAAEGYEALQGRVPRGEPFVPFDEAFEAVLGLVGRLGLPA